MNYVRFLYGRTLFFHVLRGGSSQILRNGYYPAFNFSVTVDR